MTTPRSHPTPARRQRGAAVIELALTLMLLLVLLVGTAEYGRAIYTYNTLTKAVRSAARYLSLSGPSANTHAQDEARNLVLYGNLRGEGPLLAPGLRADRVVICTATLCPSDHANVATGSGNIELTTVRISGYVYTSMLGTTLVPATINFNSIGATVRAQP